MAYIELVDVCKTLKEGRRSFSMQNINLKIPNGKITVILGPSGCGKSTLLRLIAGLLPLDSGVVKFDNLDMAKVRTGERQIGIVFQNYALYPNFSVKQNILSYFVFHKKTPELDQMALEKFQRTSDLMGVDIEYLLDRRPDHLSGGEKQRVALARCITRDPRVFLLDEPFSNLDQKMREKYRLNLKSLLRQFGITTVYVTHDQAEAMILADQIAVMDIGRIVQVGTYEELYEKPDNLFVAEFLNPISYTPPINLIDGERISREFQGYRLGIRPEDIEIGLSENGYGMAGLLTEMERLPINNQYIAMAKANDLDLGIQLPVRPAVETYKQIWLKFNKFHVFDAKSGSRLKTVSEN